MSLPCPEPESHPLDLSAPAPLADYVTRVEKLPVGAGIRRAVQILTADDDPRYRVHGLCDVYRKLETAEIVDHLKGAARLAVRQDPAGLRLLFAFLEVKRPGVEVMRQIEKLSSLERVGLRLLSGSWTDPDDPGEASAALVTGTLKQASRIGALGKTAFGEVTQAGDFRDAIGRLREWFRRSGSVLDSGRKLPAAMLNVVVDVANLEIAMMERRLSRIASRIDPYDSRGISRLMPVVSFYDQDIEHLKNVVSRLETYRPFHERLLTMEQTLTTREIDAIAKTLAADRDGEPVSEMLGAMRARPLLDREFAFLVAAVHQVAAERARVFDAPAPDVLSVMLQVVRHADLEGGIDLVLEPDFLQTAEPALVTQGLASRTAAGLRIAYRDDRAGELVLPDGLPRLVRETGERKAEPLSVRDLIMAQIGNEPFLMGILENGKVTGHPGVITAIVMHCRSLRVLSRIASTRRLHTGPANKDVPRLLLLSPVRVPVNTLKSLIHVRFVSRVDLERLDRSGNEIRSEVRKEIHAYLQVLKR